MFDKKNLLEVSISAAFKNEVLEYITKGLEKSDKKYYIVTPNPELLMIAHKNSEYREVLNNAELALPDGVGLMWASRILNLGLKERITGTDLVENVCKEVAKKPITVGFLGAGPGVAVRTAECLQKKYPGLKIGFTGSEWNVGNHIDILFVAFGSPKQEIWISQNLDNLPVKIVIGVGGAFDFISGSVKRAPVWIQKIGFEWLFRLIIQPWRIKRQLALPKFTFLVLKEKISPATSAT